jgi:hypothetical protein
LAIGTLLWFENYDLIDFFNRHKGAGASIMASATPFCFCTTQKHFSAKIVIISMAYGIISPIPL